MNVTISPKAFHSDKGLLAEADPYIVLKIIDHDNSECIMFMNPPDIIALEKALSDARRELEAGSNKKDLAECP